MAEYLVLSNYGVRYFLGDYTDSETVPANTTGMFEIKDVISSGLGNLTKETAKQRTLNSDGWEYVAALGNTQAEATFNCIRTGQGTVYEGAPGTETFTYIKDWFMKATANAGTGSPKCLIEVLPRGLQGGNPVYEGTCYYVLPSGFNNGEKNTTTGQEYTFNVAPFGPPVPVTVTAQDGSDGFTFAKAGA